MSEFLYHYYKFQGQIQSDKVFTFILTSFPVKSNVHFKTYKLESHEISKHLISFQLCHISLLFQCPTYPNNVILITTE